MTSTKAHTKDGGAQRQEMGSLTLQSAACLWPLVLKEPPLVCLSHRLWLCAAGKDLIHLIGRH